VASSSIVHRLHTKQPTVCAVCRRRAVWLGYAPVGKHLTHLGPVLWLCNDQHCFGAGKVLYHMASKKFDEIEHGAMLEAGAEAARYLEACGTTDLARLADHEWSEFLRRVVTGFGASVRRQVLDAQVQK
jgi:hypothetical protein